VSEAVIIALIVAIPPTLLALAAMIASLRNGRAVEKVHIAINSRLTELLESSSALAASKATAAEKVRAGEEARGK
jgi:hypothetical protein